MPVLFPIGPPGATPCARTSASGRASAKPIATTATSALDIHRISAASPRPSTVNRVENTATLPPRQALESRQAVGNLVKNLFVDRVDGHLWRAEQAWIVKRAHLQDHGGKTWRPGCNMRAAVGAELA